MSAKAVRSLDCGPGGSFTLYLDRTTAQIVLRSGRSRVVLPAVLTAETTAMYFDEAKDADGFIVRKVGSTVVRGSGLSAEFWTGTRWRAASPALAAAAAAAAAAAT